MSDCRTITTAIQCPQDEVYDYLADPANFPRWSLFIREIRQEGDSWIAQTTNGPVSIRFTPRNAFGILDHEVTVSPELKVQVPMRVVAHGSEASAVLFTVFRLPGMNDAEFNADVAMVEQDMTNLKGTLEG